MTTTKKQRPTFYFLQISGWILAVYLIYAQGIAAFSYELGIRMGTQEPASQITEVGTAFWYGFALGDLLTYIPILLIGLIGHALNKHWGRIIFAAALGITVYWPIVCLVALVDAQDAAGWHMPSDLSIWTFLLLIAAYGVGGLWLLLRESQQASVETTGREKTATDPKTPTDS